MRWRRRRSDLTTEDLEEMRAEVKAQIEETVKDRVYRGTFRRTGAEWEMEFNDFWLGDLDLSQVTVNGEPYE